MLVSLNALAHIRWCLPLCHTVVWRHGAFSVSKQHSTESDFPSMTKAVFMRSSFWSKNKGGGQGPSPGSATASSSLKKERSVFRQVSTFLQLAVATKTMQTRKPQCNENTAKRRSTMRCKENFRLGKGKSQAPRECEIVSTLHWKLKLLDSITLLPC